MGTYIITMTDVENGVPTRRVVTIEADHERVAYWKALALHGSDCAEIVSVRRARDETVPDRVLSPGEAANRLGVDRRTINNWVRAGKLAAFRTPGGHWRIEAKEVEKMRRGK
jgi:excisionase family DNA binding protein